MNWPVRTVRLSSNPGDAGLWCGTDGLKLSGRSLLKRTTQGFATPPLSEIQDVLDRAYGRGSGLEAEDYLSGLGNVARYLNRGDLPLAMISSLMLKLPDVPDTKRAYDDTELRDSRGRWAQNPNGGTRQSLLEQTPAEISPGFLRPETQAAAGSEISEASVVTDIAEGSKWLLPWAGRIGGAVVGSLIPTIIDNVHYGEFPGFPGLTYRSDEGIVTVRRLDANGNIENLYQGFPDSDGFYHDAQDNIVGQHAGPQVIFGSDFLTELAAKPARPPQAGTDVSLAPDSAPAEDGDEPRVCPPPTPENIAGRSARSLAYQSQITGLPIGWDVLYHGRRFDGCNNDTQFMQEAKGPMSGYLTRLDDDQLRKEDFYTDIMKQARRQNEAAADRGVDWYFADEKFAAFFGKEFEREGYSHIVVHYKEAIVKKIEDCLALVRHHLDVWRFVSQHSMSISTSMGKKEIIA